MDAHVDLTVCGTSWCPDVARSRALLDSHEVPYTYRDVEVDDDAHERCVRSNGGVRRVPTLFFDSGRVLIEPSDRDLLKALQDENLLEH